MSNWRNKEFPYDDLAHLTVRQLKTSLIIARRKKESTTFILREFKRRGIKP